jgi:phosphoadenosine phosphosulfate reductase
METLVSQFQTRFQNGSAQEILAYFVKEYQGRIALASSLGAEDQVLTDMVLKIDRTARIFTLDTGRLPQETYTVITETMKKYGMNYEIYFPRTEALEEMERSFGPNLFYESVAFRKQCCQVRKVEPLQRVLSTIDVWITGLRREQAVTRTGLETIEWDGENGLLKLNPLSDWTTEEVWDYLKIHQVPYNQLHDQGYPSIGCAPCTRSVNPGEDIRAGRWWWEAPEHKECGLHYRGGKLEAAEAARASFKEL